MSVTRDTAQFEISLLNTDAPLNAVQIIQEQEYNNGRKKRQRTQIPKGRRKLENNILVGYSLLDTKMENYKYTNKKGDKRIEIEMVTY